MDNFFAFGVLLSVSRNTNIMELDLIKNVNE